MRTEWQLDEEIDAKCEDPLFLRCFTQAKWRLLGFNDQGEIVKQEVLCQSCHEVIKTLMGRAAENDIK
jgi:hypothetical protein